MRNRSVRRALVSALPLLFAALPACDAANDTSVHVGVDEGLVAPKGGGTWAGGGGTWSGGGGTWGGGGSLFAGGGGFWSGGGSLWSGGGGLWGGGGGQWSGGTDVAGGGGWWSGGGGQWNGGGGTWSGGGNWWNGGGGLWGAGGSTWAGGGGLWSGGFATAIPFVGWHGSRQWKYRGVPKPGGYQAAVTTTWPAFSTTQDTTACTGGQVRLGGFATNFDADGWPGFLALGYSKALCIPTPGSGGLRVQATAGDGSMAGIGGYVLGAAVDNTATGQVAKDKFMLTSLVGVGPTNVATQYGGALCASIGTLAAAKRSCAVGIAFSDPNTARDGVTSTVRGVTVKTGAQANVASFNTPFGRPDGHGIYGEAAGDMESYANRVMQEHSLALPTAANAIDAWNENKFSTTVSMKGSDFTPRPLSTSANAATLLANINRSLVSPLDMVPVDAIAASTTVQNTERITNMNSSVNLQNGKMYALNMHSLAEQQNPLFGSGGGRWFFHDPTDTAAASKPLLDLSAIYQQTPRFLTGKFAFSAGTLDKSYISDADTVYADWRPNPAGTFGVDHAGQWPTAIASDADRDARLRAALTLPAGAINVASGAGHVCSLSIGGAVKCWGDNASGQLGDGTTTPTAAPVQVVGLTSGVTAISAGWAHTCALLAGGAVKCWGMNTYGAVGDGTFGPTRTTPVQVSGLTSGVRALASGGNHQCALLATGSVKCWGQGDSGQLGMSGILGSYETPQQAYGLTSGVTAIAAGSSHTCALLSTGAVKCWGFNTSGQVGNSTVVNQQLPVQVSGLTSGVAALGLGMLHSCAVLATGAVKCWGSNTKGQLGDNTLVNKSAPVQASGLTSGATAAIGGYEHSCALLSTGLTKCWGNNANGQLGDGTTVDKLVPAATLFASATALSVSNSNKSTCVRTSAVGDVQCAGSNANGQLGTPSAYATPQAAILSTGVTTGAIGRQHSCGVVAGAVKCWGDNHLGQLGDGSTTLVSVSPLQVSGLTSGVTAVTSHASGYHSCALLSTGAV